MSTAGREIRKIVDDTVGDRAKVREMVVFLLEVTGACHDAGCPPDKAVPAFIREQAGQIVHLTGLVGDAMKLTPEELTKIAAVPEQLGSALEAHVQSIVGETVDDTLRDAAEICTRAREDRVASQLLELLEMRRSKSDPAPPAH